MSSKYVDKDCKCSALYSLSIFLPLCHCSSSFYFLYYLDEIVDKDDAKKVDTLIDTVINL